MAGGGELFVVVACQQAGDHGLDEPVDGCLGAQESGPGHGVQVVDGEFVDGYVPADGSGRGVGDQFPEELTQALVGGDDLLAAVEHADAVVVVGAPVRDRRGVAGQDGP